MISYRTYRVWRSRGFSPVAAVAFARAEQECTIDIFGDSWTGEYDGFDVTVTLSPDIDADYDYHGSFSDKWQEGAIENPHANWHNEVDMGDRVIRTPGTYTHYFKWFHPQETEEELRNSLVRYYGRAVAADKAREYVETALRSCLEPEQYTVAIEVKQGGISIAEWIIGGVEWNRHPDLYIWMDFLPEAIAEARYNIETIIENNSEVA